MFSYKVIIFTYSGLFVIRRVSQLCLRCCYTVFKSLGNEVDLGFLHDLCFTNFTIVTNILNR